MVHKLFQKTDLDEEFYNQHIKNRLPDNIYDFHVHMNLPEHVANITPERIKQDWALESGLVMTYEDSEYYYQKLLPDKTVNKLVFPWPLPEADIFANNNYLSELIEGGKLNALMTVAPDYSNEYCDEGLRKKGFMGFKPYPYFASQEKGAEVSIYSFMTEPQLKILNDHKKILLMHLPRSGRLPDNDNIREILEIRQKYPDIKFVLAHFGRSFNHKTLESSLQKLGADVNGFYFDTAAVINPKVFEVAFEGIPEDNILFGTDMPILWWHGKQTWEQPAPNNFPREAFSWKVKTTEDETGYTYILYEQLKNILDVIGENHSLKNKLFHKNAEYLLGKD